MSGRPAWPWLKKPQDRLPGHLALGYYQGRETERAVLFDYHGSQIWIPKKTLVWQNGHFMAPAWAIESSKRFQQTRGKSTMSLIYGTKLLHRFAEDQVPEVCQIKVVGKDGSTSKAWCIQNFGVVHRQSAWLSHADVLAGRAAYIEVHGNEKKAVNDNVDWNIRAQEGHARNVAAGWWTAVKSMPTVQPGDDLHGIRNTGELLMLCVSEVAEAAEGIDEQTDTPNQSYMDDKLPHRPMFEVELADTKIRLFDLAGAHMLDLDGARADIIALGLTPFAIKHSFGADHYLLTIVRELASAMEGHRKNGPDLQIVGRKRFEVRIAMALMWIDAIGAEYGLDVEGAITEKEAFNAVRPDHKLENRQAAGGKVY